MNRYDTLLSRLRKPRKTATRDDTIRAHRAYCPCCQTEGRGDPSLSVAETDTGRVLTHCHKGCTHAETMAAAGMDPSTGNEMPGRAQPRPSEWLSAIALLDGLVDKIAGLNDAHAEYIAATHKRDPANPEDREATLDAVERWLRYRDNCQSYALGARAAAIEAMRKGGTK